MTMNKQCRTCQRTLPIEQFYLAKTNQDGRRNDCRPCALAAMAARHAAHPEIANTRSKAWALANPERCRETKARHYARTKEERRAQMRAWRLANPEKNREIARRWRERNKDRKRSNDANWRAENRERLAPIKRTAALRRKFGLTTAQYERMLAHQGGVCAICKSEKTGAPFNGRFAVDHIENGTRVVIRGLLCRACNTAIGLLRDNPDVIRRAAIYVEDEGLPVHIFAPESGSDVGDPSTSQSATSS